MPTAIDNFNRANNSVLGTASGGFSWNTFRSTFGISANQASGGDNTAMSRAEQDIGADHKAKVTVAATAPLRGVLLRATTGDNECYFCTINNGDPATVQIWKFPAFSVLFSNTMALPSSPFSFEGRAVGSTISAYVNDVLIVSGTDSSYGPSRLRTGIVGTFCTLDDFIAEEISAPSSFGEFHNILTSFRFEDAATQFENTLRHSEQLKVNAGAFGTTVGKHGNGGSLNGATVLKVATGTPWLGLGGAAKQLSVSLWVKANVATPAGLGHIIGEWNLNAQRSWRIVQKTDGTVELQLSNTGATANVVVNAGALGTAWTHLVATIDQAGAQMRLYKNATAFGPATPGAWFSHNEFLVGGSLNSASAGEFWSGTVDNVQVYAHHKDQTWVNDNYHSGQGRDIQLTRGAIAGGGGRNYGILLD